MDIEVRQGLVIGVQVEHQVRRSGQFHQAFLPVPQVGGFAREPRRLIEQAVEVLPGGVMYPPENPPLTKLPDTEGVGLGYHCHCAFKPPLVLGDLQPRHQRMQHQHAGDFIGVHTRLQMHRRPAAITLVTPSRYA
ncbi:hypothetical protein D3C76_854940 [compost metagenome]